MDTRQETDLTGAESRRRRSGPHEQSAPRGAGSAEGARKRFIVIVNGRGVIAEGDDLGELEQAYGAVATSTSLPDLLGSGRSGSAFPPFARLSRCDHEGETGKICILDAEEAADSVKAYYNMGFVV